MLFELLNSMNQKSLWVEKTKQKCLEYKLYILEIINIDCKGLELEASF